MPSSVRKSLPYSVIASLSFIATAVHADTPLGWISTGNPAAYTMDQGHFEISGTYLAVNDTIDFLNVRDDLLAGQQRLVGDSGDLQGTHFEVHYGITQELEVFFSHRDQDFTVDLGTINSVNVLEISPELATRMQRIGAQWTFWRGDLLNTDNRTSAASLEISAFQNESKDFNVVTDRVTTGGFTVSFATPTTFGVDELEDDGWKARLVYSWPVNTSGVGSVWASYSDSEASSGTSSTIDPTDIPSVAALFEQTFRLDETIGTLGASLTLNLTPRLPLTVSYEFINITDSSFERTPLVPPSGLPGFLTARPTNEDSNHTLEARLSYWITPRINLALTGALYSHQFLGVLPHYNNPLSGSFADKAYGFAGLQLGFRL